MVLPKGVSSVNVSYYHYFDIDKRYDPDGDVEDIAADYNRSLDSTVFTDLAGLDAFVVDGIATLGDSVVDLTREYRWWEIAYSYGVTDKLSVGVLIPYNFTKNNINAYLDTSTADVGTNPFYTLATFNPADPATYPIIPVAFGGQPLDIDDVFDLLGPGLDVDGNGAIEGPEPVGFGYDQVKSWSGSGIGDIELLGKYKLYDKEDWRLAFTGGIRLPTGESDDPDNLMDVPFGDGSTDLILRFHADYTGVDKLFLNATIKYDIQLPDEETVRVSDDVNLPLAANKEKVDRDLGDVLDLEFMGSYSLSREWSLGLKYRYTAKGKDKVDGDLGYAYSSLESETDFTSHMGYVLVGYSTVRKYMDEKTGIPFDLNLAYRDRFAGKNNVTDSRFVSVDFSLYF